MALLGCLWLTDFAAWAVQREDRLLGFGPFFVHLRDKIVAVSDLAAEAGILRGWTPQRALSLVPDAESVPLDVASITFAWGEVLADLYGLTPRIEAVREGLAYFEVPTRKEGQESLSAWVLDVGARCGIADGRAAAELAAYHALPGAICPVPSKSIHTFLGALPVETLAHGGVTEDTILRLRWFGWDTVGSMREVDARHLRELFEDGRTVARFAAAGAASQGERAPVTPYCPPVTIAARIAFDEPATEPCEWEPAFDELLPRLCAQLNGREGASLTLAANTSKGRKVGTCLLREPLREARRLREPVLDLARSMLGGGLEVHALEVVLGSLGAHLHQNELFDSNQKRHERLVESLRLMKSRGIADILRLRVRDAFAVLEEDRYEAVPWLEAGTAGRPARSRRVAA